MRKITWDLIRYHHAVVSFIWAALPSLPLICHGWNVDTKHKAALSRTAVKLAKLKFGVDLTLNRIIGMKFVGGALYVEPFFHNQFRPGWLRYIVLGRKYPEKRGDRKEKMGVRAIAYLRILPDFRSHCSRVGSQTRSPKQKHGDSRPQKTEIERI